MEAIAAAAALESALAAAWAAAITWAGVLPVNSGSQIGEPLYKCVKKKKNRLVQVTRMKYLVLYSVKVVRYLGCISPPQEE